MRKIVNILILIFVCISGALFFVPILASWLIPKEVESQAIKEAPPIERPTRNKTVIATKRTALEQRAVIENAVLNGDIVEIDVAKAGLTIDEINAMYVDIAKKYGIETVPLEKPVDIAERIKSQR